MVAKYETPPSPGNPTATEAWALTQAAVRLSRARDSGNLEEIQAALRLNWQLWTIFQSELLSANSTVPDEVRSNVLSLSNFVDKHTLQILREPKPQNLDVLITINRELAAGLREALGGTATPDGAPPPPTPDEGGITA